MPVDTRAMAMGDAGATLAFNSLSMFWNPASVSFMPGYDVRIEGARIYGMSSQGLLSLSVPMQDGLNAGIMYDAFFPGPILQNDTLPGTLVDRLGNEELRADGSAEGWFQNNQNLVLLGIGKKFGIPVPRPPGVSFPIPVNLGIGVNAKYLWQTLTPGGKVRMGMNINIDVGGLLQIGVDYDLEKNMISRQVLIGAAVRNVVPTDMVWVNSPEDYSEPVDNSQYYGLAYVDDAGLGFLTWKAALGLHREKQGRIVSEENGDRTTGYVSTYHYGVEIGLWRIVDVRAGLSNRHVTLGAGVHYRNMFIDYAFRFDEVAYTPLRLAVGVSF